MTDYGRLNPDNMLGLYVLDCAGNPVEEPDVWRWGEWLAQNPEPRIVAHTELPGAVVSTVFFTVDHNYSRMLHPGEPPILFETMCFDDDMNDLPIYGGDDEESLFGRYATRAEALEGHAAIVAELKTKLGQ